MGAKILVKTLDGDIELKIPAGTQSGTIFRIKGKGVPHLNDSGRSGDLMITAHVVVPKKLSKKEKTLLKEMAEERGEVVQIDDNLWESIKDSLS